MSEIETKRRLISVLLFSVLLFVGVVGLASNLAEAARIRCAATFALQGNFGFQEFISRESFDETNPDSYAAAQREIMDTIVTATFENGERLMKIEDRATGRAVEDRGKWETLRNPQRAREGIRYEDGNGGYVSAKCALYSPGF